MSISALGQQSMERLSSGLRINSAADDAAGLAISEKMTSQTNGMAKEVENMQSMQDLSNTAEGGLNGIKDNLMRIRDLSLQASNGILTNDDKSIIQNEIDQLKEGINDIANGTSFNTKSLLDGSFSSDGLSIESSTLAALGMEDFDVTGSFDIGTIDDALEAVSSVQSELGSAYNAYEHAISNTQNSMINLTSASSQITDADMAEEVTNQQTAKLLEQYQIFAQKEQMEQEREKLGVLGVPQNYQV